MNYVDVAESLCFLLFLSFTTLVFTAQNRYDVVITEFLPDPTPSSGTTGKRIHRNEKSFQE